MKRTFKEVKKLEEIQMRLERVSKKKRNKLIEDMLWLSSQLRQAWTREENIS